MNKIFSLLMVFLFLMSACMSTSRDPALLTYKGGILENQIIAERQVIAPLDGDQKKTAPTQKTDAEILWTPPNESEKPVDHSKLLNNKYLSNSCIGTIGQLEALLASHYLEQLLYRNELLTRTVAKRANDYLPYIIKELKKRDLPIELAALPMIESTYISNAVSPAGAAGLWQIMPSTGRGLGLEVNSKNDERFHFKKSTNAALDHLERLYRTFNDWPLAISAYNCGTGRLKRALKISKTDNLLDLLAYCKSVIPRKSPLRIETQRYVPQFIAAAISLKIIGVLPNTINAASNIVKTTTPQTPTQQPLQLQGYYNTP